MTCDVDSCAWVRGAEARGYEQGMFDGFLLAVRNFAPDDFQVILRVLDVHYSDCCPAGIGRLRRHTKCWETDKWRLQLGKSHTAWQWVARGFVPNDDASWHHGKAPGYFYCDQKDVAWDPERADELLKTGPKEFCHLPDGHAYDGRPWWIPCQESDEERWQALAKAKEEAWG